MRKGNCFMPIDWKKKPLPDRDFLTIKVGLWVVGTDGIRLIKETFPNSMMTETIWKVGDGECEETRELFSCGNTRSNSCEWNWLFSGKRFIPNFVMENLEIINNWYIFYFLGKIPNCVHHWQKIDLCLLMYEYLFVDKQLQVIASRRFSRARNYARNCVLQR